MGILAFIQEKKRQRQKAVSLVRSGEWKKTKKMYRTDSTIAAKAREEEYKLKMNQKAEEAAYKEKYKYGTGLNALKGRLAEVQKKARRKLQSRKVATDSKPSSAFVSNEGDRIRKLWG